MYDPDDLIVTTCPECECDVYTEDGEPNTLCQTCYFEHAFAGMSAAEIDAALCGADAPTEAEALVTFAKTGELPF